MPVSEPGSRLSSLSETATDTLVLVSRPPRKSQLLFALRSSLRSSLLFQSVVVTGVSCVATAHVQALTISGTNLGQPHTLPIKLSGKCGSVTVRLIPAPRGTALVASPVITRLLQLAGVEDCYTASSGSTKTMENTLKATFVAVSSSYGFLTPNLWKETKLIRSPLEEYSDILREGKRY